VQPSTPCTRDACTTISGQPFGGVKPQRLQSALWCSRPGCNGMGELSTAPDQEDDLPMHAGRVHHNLQSALWLGETTKTPASLWCSRPGCTGWVNSPQLLTREIPSPCTRDACTTISGQPCGWVKPQRLQAALWCSRPGCNGMGELSIAPGQKNALPMHAGRVHHNLRSALWLGETTKTPASLWCSRPGCNGTTRLQSAFWQGETPCTRDACTTISGQPCGWVKPQRLRPVCGAAVPAAMEPQDSGQPLGGVNP